MNTVSVSLGATYSSILSLMGLDINGQIGPGLFTILSDPGFSLRTAPFPD